ncbi:transcription termination factor rho [Nonlabens ulvanivorans]|uniref:Transcription termination factor rho n=1 Tax=Nonlabens ulvanivorans TaxID=906888 RepID=A0A090WJ43_NONUL|nr:Rho termination factor N-terminal domain-containing protein [Nonlabens ulvanivorans]GAL77075.1 transcription termination factor rho [Nonlabens ulvanivorans]
MFQIADLKSKKLPELQEIAKGLNVPKYKQLRKLDLVYKILDLQAANPDVVKKLDVEATPAPVEKAAVAEKKEAPKQQRKPNPRPRKTSEKKTEPKENKTNSNKEETNKKEDSP